MPAARRRGTGATLAGLLLCLALAALALFGTLLAPHDPSAMDLLHRLEPPSWTYPLGTDQLGRCLLSRTLAGARASLGLAVLTTSLVMALAIPLGLVAAFFGGIADQALMRLVDVLVSFPSLVVTLAIIGTMGVGVSALVAGIVLAWWPAEARIIRGLGMAAMERDFVRAAVLLGVPPATVLVRHVVPQIMPPILVRYTLEFASIVLALSSLSFLGLGIQPPTPEWGVMLSDARPFLTTAPHLLIGPGIAVVVSVLALNLLGESLRDRLDLRERFAW